jgi:ribonuclease P protein component
MLAAAQRLRRRGEFAATIRGGRRAGRGGVVVHATQLDTRVTSTTGVGAPTGRHPQDIEPARAGGALPPARAGFVVSKAVGGAVVRNTVKRRLRALMRERLAGLPAGTDVVVRAQPMAAGRPYPRLAEDLDAALAAALRPGRSGRGSGRGHG